MCCIASNHHLGPPPRPDRRTEEQRPPLYVGSLLEDRNDLWVEVLVKIEHLRLVDCCVPVCSNTSVVRQLSHIVKNWENDWAHEITFSARCLQLLAVKHRDEVLNFIAASTRVSTVGPFVRPTMSKTTILPTRVRDQTSSRFAVHKDSQLTIGALVPPPCRRVGRNVCCGNEEPKTAIVQLLRLWRVCMSQYSLDGNGVEAIGRDDNVSFDDLTAGKRY